MCEHLSNEISGTPSKYPDQKRKKRNSGPDSAVSWSVAFAAFLINFIMAGLSRMSGILYVAFIDMFDTDRKGASMPFSVRSSTMNLLGPVVGILGQKYGVRGVSILGGIVGTLSSAACFFAHDITWITIVWGGLNGVGTALVSTLTTVVVSQYFDKYKTTAAGLSFSGACIGSFIFPPLIEILLDEYGLEGSFLIVAAIIMHTIPAAMLLRKPQWVKRANRLMKDLECAKTKGDESTIKSAIKSDIINDNSNSVDLTYLRTKPEMVFNLLSKDLSSENNCESCPSKEDILREMEDVYTFVGKTPVTLRYSDVPPKIRLKLECETSPVSSKSQSFRSVRNQNQSSIRNLHSSCGIPKLCSQCKPFILSKLSELYNKNEKQIVSPYDDKTLYSKVLKELRKLHKVYEAVKKRNMFAHIRTDRIPQRHTPKMQPKSLIIEPVKNSTHGLCDSLKNSMMLHTNPLFLLISVCRAVHFSTFIPVVTIIVDYMMDKGLEEEDGKYVIATLSVGDLIGRLCLGWITDRGFVSLPKYMLVTMILQGMSSAVLPSMNTMTTILPAVTIYAILQGSVFVRHNVMISKYMKSDEQSVAIGCINFFAGLLGFAVPAYVGFFRDAMGSYDGVFYCNGAVGAFIGLLWVFEPFFEKQEDNLETGQLKV